MKLPKSAYLSTKPPAKLFTALLVVCLAGNLISFSVVAGKRIQVSSSATQTAVLELYTSQGCSSCPPADDWLTQLSKTPNSELKVLALAFHVDYWDYIGWKDHFANPKHTSRQRDLGRKNNQRSIYTPEFFVDGLQARGTANVIKQIKQRNVEPTPFELQLSVSKNANNFLLELEVLASNDQKNLTESNLAQRFIVYENNLSSKVTRGENSGETLEHQRVVRYISEAQILGQNNQHQIEINPKWRLENLGVAVLVTSSKDGKYWHSLHTSVANLLAN